MRSYIAELNKPRPAAKESSKAPVVDARTHLVTRSVVALPQPAPVAPVAPVAATVPTAPPPPAVPPAQTPPPKPAPKKIHVIEHPLAQQALTILRSKQTSSRHYRQLSNQLLTLLLIEATRALPTRQHMIETAAGSHVGSVLARPVVFLTLARHGLGLAHNLAEMFPDLFVGSISLQRSADTPAIGARLHLTNAPALADANVILFDPVVSSGGTAQAALNLVQRCGAAKVTLISLLFSLPGLSHLQSTFSDLQIWTAGIDSTLDPKRGPLPGLGNFAERLYGYSGRENFTAAPW